MSKSLNQSGFTLVEVVLVMVVTGIVFVSIYGLYAHTVKQDMETRFEVMASNLAQEGIEIIRNNRDRALLRSTTASPRPIDYYLSAGNCRPFFNGDEAECNSTRIQDIGYDGTKFDSCIGACAAGTETPFSRQCNISCDANDPVTTDCIRLSVVCTVSWTSFIDPALIRNITARSVMTSWQVE